MKRGQTIVAEREYVESDSERMKARKKQKRRHMTSVILALLLIAILALLAYTGAKNMAEEAQKLPEGSDEESKITAQIIDEAGHGQISGRMRQYIMRLEGDFRDLGYTVIKVTLPQSTSRELYVDLAGVEYYFKVSMNRDAAVSAEDAVRMIKYLSDRDIHPTYVDVRVEGKGYYK